MRVRRLGRMTSFALGAVLVVAACSNDTNTASTTTATTKAGTPTTVAARIEAPNPCVNDPGVSDTTIKVGVLVPQSGPGALSFADTVGGLKARVDLANSSGELGNRKIVLDIADDATLPTRNAEAARRLIETDNVFSVVEMSSAANGSAQYLNAKAIPVVGWHVGLAEWSTYNNMFTFRQGTSVDQAHDYTSRNSDLIEKLGGTKVAAIGGANQASATFVNQIVKSIQQLKKISVAYTATDVPPDLTEFTSIVQRIKDSGADALITGMDFLQNTSLSDALTKAGVKLKVVVFPGGYDPRVLTLPGVEGATFGLEFRPLELRSPSAVAFDKAAPKSVVRGQIPYVGWLSGETLVRGIKEAGPTCPTRKAFINNLRLVTDWTANGAFDPVDLRTSFGKQFQCVYYVQVQHGKFVPLFDGKEFCGTPLKLS
jgi:branched-chain amino acid transport system substrate-binding protein